MKSFYAKNQNETIELGKRIGTLVRPNDTILLVGDLASGKTTITKGIGLGMGVNKIINSPTFTIVKEYNGTNLKLFHLDLYRLDGVGNDFDLEEYMYSGNVTVIEWPYQVKDILPDEYLLIEFEKINEDERKINITGIGKYIELEEKI